MPDPSSTSSSSEPASLPQFPLELSDADATLKVHALVAPDDTSEVLTDDDLLEEIDVDETVIVEEEPLVAVAPPSLPRPLPPPAPYRRATHSFGPVALDLTPPPSRRRADATVLLPRVRDSRRDKKLIALLAAAATFALVGVASLGAAVMYAGRTTTASARAGVTASAAAALGASVRVAAPKEEKALEEQLSELAVQAPEPAAAPAPPPATSSTASAAANAPVSSARTGMLRVPPSIHGMLVDGKPRRVDGSTVVTCGRHAIKTGIAPSRIVEVPCGGTAWL